MLLFLSTGLLITPPSPFQPGHKHYEPGVGDVVIAVGKLRIFNNRLACTLLGMRDVDSAKEVELHGLECKVAQVFYKKQILLRQPSELGEYENTIFSPYPPEQRSSTRQTPNSSRYSTR